MLTPTSTPLPMSIHDVSISVSPSQLDSYIASVQISILMGPLRVRTSESVILAPALGTPFSLLSCSVQFQFNTYSRIWMLSFRGLLFFNERQKWSPSRLEGRCRVIGRKWKL